MTSQSGLTVWLLVSVVLVMLTIPGVALFYGGMVRKKNILHTVGLPLSALVVVSVVWMLWGETLLYGPQSEAVRPRESSTEAGFQLYYTMMASLTLTLVAGGIVERVRFTFFLLFGLMWTVTVYAPVAHWLWGGGWLENLGCQDFAGGAVIHISAGVTALVTAIMVGPRTGYGKMDMTPNHLPFSFCGAALMWVGWFGFSAGPALRPMTVVTGAFVAIHLSAVAAMLMWMTVEWLQRDKPTALGMVSGAVAGLVAIAPAAGYVGPLSAVVIGIGAGGLCYMVVNYVKLILGYDDSLDVFGMHGVGGTWGMVATGLFASTEVNADGSDGLFYGYPYQFFVQVLAALVVWVFAGATSTLLFLVLKMFHTPRVDEQAEMMGLDLAQHGEKGYS